VPGCQWVLSLPIPLPIPLRLPMAAQPKLVTPVHGTLHAQGYGHETGEARVQAMEGVETRSMAMSGFADPCAAKRGTHPFGRC